MIRFAEIALGDSGGPRCRRCSPGVQPTPMEAPAILAAIRSAPSEDSSHPGLNISFGGMEPFDHPDLPRLVDTAAQVGAARIRLETNCHALVSPETSVQVLRAGVRHIRAALLGSSAGMHDELSGAPGGFERTMRGLKVFAEVATELDAKIHESVLVPVCRHNVRDVPEIVRAVAEAGVVCMTLAVEDPRLDPATAAPWLEAACDTGVVSGVWVEVEGLPYGFARGWELHLASVYHHVSGEKAATCAHCPLETVCGGVPAGASDAVLATLSPPDDAAQMAEGITHGFTPLGEDAQ